MSKLLRTKRAVKVDEDRKSLKEVQYSSDGKGFVASPVMSKRVKKTTESSTSSSIKIHSDTKMDNKENLLSSRPKRSKNSTKENTKDVPVVKSQSVAKKEKKKASIKVSKNVQTSSKQPKNDILTAVSEVEVVQPSDVAEAIDHAPSVTKVFRSVSDDVSWLTSDVPNESYWKEIAEQRQIAMEQTIYENVQLEGQLEVLVAENKQLRSLLKECEKIFEAC